MDKKELRDKIKKRRCEFSEECIAELSDAITARLLEIGEIQKAQIILCYYPIKGEPDTRKLMDRLREIGKCVCLPIVEGSDMRAVIWEANGELEKVPPGVMQPAEGEEPQKIDAVIVPGLAFDKKGMRLGFGGGYYDRFLANCDAFRIGIVFDEFVQEELKTEPWDIAMDAVLTDRHFFDFTSGKK